MKRRLIVAAGIGVLTVATATPALAFWNQGASSTFNVTATASKPGPPPTATATRTNGNPNAVTITVTGAPTGGFDAGQGYTVTEDTSGATCTIGPVVGNSCVIANGGPGNKKYTITAFAGPWTATTSRVCTFANGGATTATCTTTTP